MKTILLHVQNDAGVVQRLETALSLARACGAHLDCLQVTQMEAYVAVAPTDNFGGVLSESDAIKASTNEEVQLRLRVEEKLRSEDATWDYSQVTGDPSMHLIRHAALTDLTVIGREPQGDDFTKPTLGLLGDLLHQSSTPLFIPAMTSPLTDPTGSAAIAWDASREAANAVKAAVGLLRFASDVRVIQVREQEKDEELPAIRLLEYLSRYGIKADVHVEPFSGSREAIADVVVAFAKNMAADYIVMGGHRRGVIRRYLFGGVTQTLLTDCPLPLFIAN